MGFASGFQAGLSAVQSAVEMRKQREYERQLAELEQQGKTESQAATERNQALTTPQQQQMVQGIASDVQQQLGGVQPMDTSQAGAAEYGLRGAANLIAADLSATRGFGQGTTPFDGTPMAVELPSRGLDLRGTSLEEAYVQPTPLRQEMAQTIGENVRQDLARRNPAEQPESVGLSRKDLAQKRYDLAVRMGRKDDAKLFRSELDSFTQQEQWQQNFDELKDQFKQKFEEQKSQFSRTMEDTENKTAGYLQNLETMGNYYTTLGNRVDELTKDIVSNRENEQAVRAGEVAFGRLAMGSTLADIEADLQTQFADKPDQLNAALLSARKKYQESTGLDTLQEGLLFVKMHAPVQQFIDMDYEDPNAAIKSFKDTAGKIIDPDANDGKPVEVQQIFIKDGKQVPAGTLGAKATDQFNVVYDGRILNADGPLAGIDGLKGFAKDYLRQQQDNPFKVLSYLEEQKASAVRRLAAIEDANEKEALFGDILKDNFMFLSNDPARVQTLRQQIGMPSQLPAWNADTSRYVVPGQEKTVGTDVRQALEITRQSKADAQAKEQARIERIASLDAELKDVSTDELSDMIANANPETAQDLRDVVDRRQRIAFGQAFQRGLGRGFY